MLHRFRRDPHLVLKYNAVNALMGTGALVLVRQLWPSTLDVSPLWLLALGIFVIPEFFVQIAGGTLVIAAFIATGGVAERPWLLLLLPAAAYAAAISGMLMHNSAHMNLRPRWLNRVVGEVCGFHQLGGWVVWTIVHLVHHRHADDPVLDPHPPGNKSFAQYIRSSFVGLITCMNRLYRETWTAKNPAYGRGWILAGATGALARCARLGLMLAVLGPAGYALFFVPSYVVVTLLYWHFNYATHRPAADGTMEVRDLDHNTYYRVANRVLGGFYFHKTHHEKPFVFNPWARAPERR